MKFPNSSTESGDAAHTGSKYLRQDAFLVGAVDVVRRLSSFVGPVQEAAIFWVPEQQLGQLSAAPADRNVQGGVPFLKENMLTAEQKERRWFRVCRAVPGPLQTLWLLYPGAAPRHLCSSF